MKRNADVNGISVDRLVGHDANLQGNASIATEVLWIVVPYTTTQLTRAALRHSAVCSDLNVHVCLVDVQVVPFPCPLDQPPVNKEYSQNRLQALLAECTVPGHATVLYTRDWLEAFHRMLTPESLVIIPTKKRWWRTREEKLAGTLRKAGHEVLLLPL